MHDLNPISEDERLTLENINTSASVFKDILKSCSERLIVWFQQETAIESIVLGRSKMMDELLHIIWHRYIDTRTDITLIAVGGYGRSELHPYSDIDLLILVRNDAESFRTALEGFLTFLWDIGLDVGHSVRTVTECLVEAKKDITIATNLIESRQLEGDAELFTAIKDKVTWEDAAFFQAKKNEQRSRHHRFDDTAYNLEPNLKDGPGGLRDLHTIGWIAKRHFGVDSIQGLLNNAFLTEQEFEILHTSRAFLWRVRFALHTTTTRHEDRLLFDHQANVAKQLGYLTNDHEPDVERLMKNYYRAVMKISRLNEMLLQLFEEAILGAPTSTIQPLTALFQIRNNYLEVTSEDVFERHPYALLEIFLFLEKNPQFTGIRASSIRLIRQYRYLIDDKFRADEHNKALFLSIMLQPQGLTHVLRKMNQYGILAAYLPVFENIVGQMQYDLFHHYTVDEHTLFVVRNLRRLTVPEYHDELPFLSDLMYSVPNPGLLYLAGLFHDIGKGRGGNHSDLGAQDAESFCLCHGMNRQDTHMVRWLVENHLIMSMTAQRKDISDPEVVHEFARKVSTPLRLKYLYLLTVSDIRATNPTLWNTWKDSLLNTLYKATQAMLNKNLELPVDQTEFVENTKKIAKASLQKTGLSDADIEQVWQFLENDYFLRCHEDQIIQHTQYIIRHLEDPNPLVLVSNHESSGGTEIFIYMPDSECLFAVVTAVLEQLCFNIVDAWIVTTLNHHTLDSFHILDENNHRITHPPQIDMLVEKLTRALRDIENYPLGVSRHIPRQIKHFDHSTHIHFQQAHKSNRTILNLDATDKPGLLSRIGLAFSELQINLHNAKISTVGARVEDCFYISGADGCAIKDEKKLKQLENFLIDTIEQ